MYGAEPACQKSQFMHSPRQGRTLVQFSAQHKHICGLHTSTSQCVVITFGGLRRVFELQIQLRLSWEVYATCGFNDQNWLRLS
jgi:hypothetical protein